MQIKSLVALLPLLLGQVSSVALPPAPDSCGAIEGRLRRNADLQDVPKHLLSRCVQRRELEGHLELVSRDIDQWESSNNGQDHIISARAPPKDGSDKTEKNKKTGQPQAADKTKNTGKTVKNPGKTDNTGTTPAAAGPAGSQAEKSAEEKKKQSQPQQQSKLTHRPKNPANKNDQQPQAPADGGGSGNPSDSEAEKKKAEEEKKDKGKKKDEGQKPNQPSNGPSDGDDSPSESESSSSSDGEDSDGEYEPPSESEDDSEDERRKKKEANEAARKKKQEEKEKQKQIDKERAPKTMYHAVTPDPKKSEGIKDKGTKEEDRYYLRKIGDGLPRHRYKTHNPAHSVVESGDQEPGREKTDTDPGQKRPGRIEEEATTGHKTGKGGYPSLEHCSRLTVECHANYPIHRLH